MADKIVCFYCGKAAAKQFIKCTKCDKAFHNSCAERGKVKFISETEINCVKCMENDNEVLAGNTNLLMFRDLIKAKEDIIEDKMKIIALKDEIITELHEKIRLLNEKIHFIKSCNNKGEVSKVMNPNSHQIQFSSDLKYNRLHKEGSTPIMDKESNLKLSKVQEIESKQKEIANKVIYINNDENQQEVNTKSIEKQLTIEKENSSNNWSTVVKRRSKTSKKIEGCAEKTTISGVPRRAHLHVYRLNPETTEEMLLNFLKGKQFENISCEAMKSKHPNEYSSFKVSVPMDQLEKIKCPEIWPKGVYINRFFVYGEKRHFPS